MRLHAPELKKIQERYKDDRVRQQEETMKYYKEAGVNPFATCLPLLLQFPVLISLVYMLRTDLQGAHLQRRPRRRVRTSRPR